MLASLLGVTLESRLSGYLFQRRGKHRMIAFESEIEIIGETNGNWYIQQLLTKPGVAFRCTELESLFSGLSEKTSQGSIGEVVDPESLRAYNDRIKEIDEEIEEAIQFNDPALQEKLLGEREAILKQVKAATGIGGRIGNQFDAERSRKTVARAITRAMDTIATVHPELGQHLRGSINLGLEVSYTPNVAIAWLF